MEINFEPEKVIQFFFNKMVANKMLSNLCVNITELLIKNWLAKSLILVKFGFTLRYKTLEQLSSNSENETN